MNTVHLHNRFTSIGGHIASLCKLLVTAPIASAERVSTVFGNRRYISILGLVLSLYALLFCLPAPAAVTQHELVVTNTAITSNSLTWKGVARIFTNATTPTTILTNLAGPKQTATNVFNAFGQYLPAGGVTITWSSPTSMVFLATDGQLSVSGGGQPAWAYVTTNSAATTNYYALMVPHYNMPGANPLPKKTNDADYAIELLSFARTNAFAETWQGLSNHVGRTRSQDIGNKRLTNSVLDSDSRITNVAAISGTNYQLYYGRYINASNHTPVIFSGVNYSNAFSSVGSGTDSEQFGTGATASGLRSTALGKTASATNTDSSAFGYNSVAGGISSLALGTSAGALGTNSTAIGAGSSVSATSGNSHAYGTGVEITHKGAIVIGNGITSRETNDTLLANETITLRGRVRVDGTQTNTTFTGTNQWTGDIATPVYSLATLANGNNIAVDFGTNYWIRLAPGAVSAVNAICGLADGRDGLEHLVFNDQGYACTLAVNTVDPTPANRFETYSGVDVSLPNQGWAIIKYEPNAARWVVANVYPTTATATNAMGFLDGNGTNAHFYPSTTNNVAVTIHQLSNQSNDLFQVVSSSGVPLAKHDAAGTLIQSNVTANSLAYWNPNKQLTNVPTGSIWAVPSSSDGTNVSFGDDGFFGPWGRKRLGWIIASGSTTLQVQGDIATTVGTASASMADADNPTMHNLVTTAATTGTDLGWSGNNTLNNHFNRTLRAHCWIKMVETNQVRYWFGFVSGTATTMAGADAQTSDHAAFRYSSQAPEITWKCSTADNTTQGVTDSTTATTTDDVVLSLVYAPGVSVKFYVNGTLVATRTTNLPRSSVACRLIAYGETTENANKNLRIAHCVWEEVK